MEPQSIPQRAFVAAGLCSNQTSTHILTNQLSDCSDQLIKCVSSGVLLHGWNKNLQPRALLWNGFGIPILLNIGKSNFPLFFYLLKLVLLTLLFSDKTNATHPL